MTRPAHITETIADLERRRDEAAAEVERYDLALHTLLGLWPGDAQQRTPTRKEPLKSKKNHGNRKSTTRETPAANGKRTAAQERLLVALEPGAKHRDELVDVLGVGAGPLSRCITALKGLELVAEDNGFVRLTEAGECAAMEARTA